MKPFVQFFLGTSTLGGAAANAWSSALNDGAIVKATSSKIVVADDNGHKVVFTGEFVVGPDIAGTMTGFKLVDNGVKLELGGSFSIDGADLQDALNGITVSIGQPSKIVADLIGAETLVVKGSDQADTLEVPKGSPIEVIKGRAGDDVLISNGGSQTLKGGKGNDYLNGGDNHDILKGGKGHDTFAFVADLGSTTGVTVDTHDKIVDFSHKDDTIALDTGLIEPGFLGAKYFHIGTSATTADHRVIYDKATGHLYYDLDGTGTDYDQVHFATVAAGTKIHADDFLIFSEK